jgi:hypothetical protein
VCPKGGKWSETQGNRKVAAHWLPRRLIWRAQADHMWVAGIKPRSSPISLNPSPSPLQHLSLINSSPSEKKIINSILQPSDITQETSAELLALLGRFSTCHCLPRRGQAHCISIRLSSLAYCPFVQHSPCRRSWPLQAHQLLDTPWP